MTKIDQNIEFKVDIYIYRINDKISFKNKSYVWVWIHVHQGI